MVQVTAWERLSCQACVFAGCGRDGVLIRMHFGRNLGCQTWARLQDARAGQAVLAQ